MRHWRCVAWYDIVIISWLVSNVYFNCIDPDAIYYDMNIATVWHCTSVSHTPPLSIGRIFVCALFWCWVSICDLVSNSLIDCYFIMTSGNIIGFSGYSIHFLTTQFGLCYYVVLVLQQGTSFDVSAPRHFLWILDWICYRRTPLYQFEIFYKDIILGSSRLCDWLSLWCLLPRMNHLPPVCRSTFRIYLVWNDGGFVSMT